MDEFQILVFLFFVFASPMAIALPYVLYRWVRGFRKKELLPGPARTLLVESLYCAFAAGAPVRAAGVLEEGATPVAWAVGSGLIAALVSWRLYGLLTHSDGEPWARYAASGSKRFVAGGAVLVLSVLVTNALAVKAFAPLLVGVAWFPVVAVVGFRSERNHPQTSR